MRRKIAVPGLIIDRVSKRYVDRQQEVVALDGVSAEIGDSEFAAIVGPSGCGKSTLLKIVAGLEKATSGQVLLGGRPVEGPGADRGMVFQSYTLFPWLTVLENVEFGLRMRGVPKAERQAIAREYLKKVRLSDFENLYPQALSGGMKQRVAIARALANDPEVLLMDEPFGALDAQTRVVMQELLLNIWEQQRKTILFITHDIDEAIFLADTVYVMTRRPGRFREAIQVSLPRPRDHRILVTPEFVALKARVTEMIWEESKQAAEDLHL